MKHTEIIKDIMRKKRITQSVLSERMGFYGPSSVSLRLTTRKNGTIMNTVDMLEALDYEMVIRPASKEALGPNEYLLLASDYEEES